MSAMPAAGPDARRRERDDPAFSVLVPGMPGMSMMEGAEVPPGWTYNPSSWVQRAPSIALAFIGYFMARYLASYQLGHITDVWDPIFGDGTDTEGEHALEEILSPHDALVRARGGNVVDLWNAAAARADGEWIVLTEAHCLGDPGCMAALSRAVERDPSLDAVSLDHGHHAENRAGVLCERWFRDLYAEWDRADWRLRLARDQRRLGPSGGGRGVFALRDIPAGTRILEYRGQVITWRTAQRRHAKTGADGHTYFFDRGDGTVIDGSMGGNSARYLNHSCAPNCEAINHHGRIDIHTTKPIAAGSELLLDYQLHLDRPTDLDSATYACACTAPGCRTTMLAQQ